MTTRTRTVTKKRARSAKKRPSKLVTALHSASRSVSDSKATKIESIVRGVISREFRVSGRVSPAKRRISSAIRAAKARARDIASRKNLVDVLRKAHAIANRKKLSAARRRSIADSSGTSKVVSAVASVLKRQGSVPKRLGSTGCQVPRCVKIKRKSKQYCACPNVYAAFLRSYKRKHPEMTHAQIRKVYDSAKTRDVQRFKNASKTIDGCSHDPVKLCKVLRRPLRRPRRRPSSTKA